MLILIYHSQFQNQIKGKIKYAPFYAKAAMKFVQANHNATYSGILAYVAELCGYIVVMVRIG